MKNIFRAFRLENIQKHLIHISTRFPVGLGIILLLSLTLFILLHAESLTQETQTRLIKIVFTLIVTFFLSIGTYIAGESKGCSRTQSWLGQIFPVVFGVGFYLFFSLNFDSFETIVRFIVSLVGIIGFLFFAPYLKEIFSNTGKQDVYYSYFFKLSVVFLWAFILGGALSVLGFIAIGTIFTLFDIVGFHQDKLYGDWAIFALSFVTPLFALTQLPPKTDFQKDVFMENKFFSFLVKFVAIPFISIYFLILYVYTLKVLLNFQDWPKGEVSWMVIGFSIFGYITYIFSYIFDDKEKLVHLLRKYFPFVVIPQIGMLFYAIYLRIAQYDITVNRYFVVVFGIWLLMISLYFALSCKKYLAYTFTLMTLFTLIISIGPWSVYSFPETRQLARLKHNLEIAGILQNNQIVALKNKGDIDAKLSGNIYDNIRYLCDLSSCKSIKELFADQYETLLQKHRQDFEVQKQKDLEYYKKDTLQSEEIQKRTYTQPYSWEIVQSITDFIKVVPYYENEPLSDVMYNFSIDYKTGYFPIDITGYSQIYQIGGYRNDGKSIYFELDGEGKNLLMKDATQTLDEFSLSSFQQALIQKYKNFQNSDVEPTDLQGELVGKTHQIKVQFDAYSFKNPQYTGTGTYYSNTNGFILLK